MYDFMLSCLVNSAGTLRLYKNIDAKKCVCVRIVYYPLALHCRCVCIVDVRVKEEYDDDEGFRRMGKFTFFGNTKTIYYAAG